MNEKHASNQERRYSRAVWLAALPSSSVPVKHGSHADRRDDAQRRVRRQGADIVGEFQYSLSVDEKLPPHVWREVLAFVLYLKAGVLVVLDPDEIAMDGDERAIRIASLGDAGVRFIGDTSSEPAEAA